MKFVQWYLIFVDSWYRTCHMSPFWHLRILMCHLESLCAPGWSYKLDGWRNGAQFKVGVDVLHSATVSRSHPSPSINRYRRIWRSEDRALWYILIVKANKMHYFSTFFGKELYMFRTDLLSTISSTNTVFTATGICHTVMLTVCQTPDDGK